MNPTIDQFNPLQAQVNQLAMQNTQLTKDVAGLKETVAQVTLLLEAELNKLNAKVADLTRSVQILSNVSQ